MLSRAAYAGRICLSCRYQLRLSRPRPLPATTTFPRLGLPRYTTGANGDADPKAKPTESKTGEREDQTRQDGSAPEQESPDAPADPVPTPEAKPAGSSAKSTPTPATDPARLPTDPVSDSEAGPDGSGSEPASSPEAKHAELETDVSTAESERSWKTLENSPQTRAKFPSRAHAEPSPQPQERAPRLRVGRNDMNVETTSLGMNILGREGHTIVLRDREFDRKEPVFLEEDLAKELDIEGSLEEQKRDITIEETRRNIDELRPADTCDLLRREFDQIKTTLMEGVTISQLEDYVCYFMGGAEGKAMSEAHKKDLLRRLTGHKRAQVRWPVKPRYGWISEQLSWKPPKNYPWGSTMKEKLALAIMRACWHLQVMEEMPYIGEVKITVDTKVLDLLLVEHKTWRAIQFSLGDGASIEIDPEARRMQIIASRSKCDAALDQLDRFVSRIKSETIPLSSLGPARLPEGILEYLGSLTGAHITYNGTKGGSAPPLTKKGTPAAPNQDNSDAINVSWSKRSGRPNTVESLKHVVFRLLLSATSPGNTKGTVKTVLDTENKIKPEDLVLLRQHADNHALPWNLRNQTWGRLVQLAQPKPSQGKREDVAAEETPGETSVVPQDEVEPAPNAQESAEPADAADEAQPGEATKQNGTISSKALRFPLLRADKTAAANGWSRNFIRTSTVFGHVLHPFPSAGQHLPLDHRRPVDPSTVALRPISPSLSALTNLAAGASAPVSTSLLIRLLPKTGPAPPLELHLDVPEQEGPLQWETTSKKLVAVLYNWAAHVRLPLHPVDVTVRQSLATEMDALNLFSSAPLRAFFEGSKLDLQSDLVTPPSLSIPLPSALLGREGSAQKGEHRLTGLEGGAQEDEEARFMGLKDNPPEEEDGHSIGLEGGPQEEVEYHFMGLELHTTATIPFRSGRLSLTSIEAGQQGRRAELAFAPGDVGLPEARDHAKTYLEEILRVADGRYFSWVGARPVDVSTIEDSL